MSTTLKLSAKRAQEWLSGLEEGWPSGGPRRACVSPKGFIMSKRINAAKRRHLRLCASVACKWVDGRPRICGLRWWSLSEQEQRLFGPWTGLVNADLGEVRP